MTQLANAVVLITGAGGGFGQQMIRQFAAAGSKLILTDVNERLLVESAAAAPQDAVLQCLTSDLSTYEGCQALHDSTERLPDILVNNAGIANYGRFDEVPRDYWERLMQINLLAPMRLTALFLPGMIARGSGHIVNIASIAGWVGSAGLVPYNTSKFGLRGFSEGLRDDLRQHNIKVTAVYPFFSKTPILDSPQFGSRTRQALPDSMVTDPAEVIRAVLQGIQRDQLHVFPDATARQLYLIQRFVPWLLPIINRRVEQQVAAE